MGIRVLILTRDNGEDKDKLIEIASRLGPDTVIEYESHTSPISFRGDCKLFNETKEYDLVLSSPETTREGYNAAETFCRRACGRD